MAFLVTGCAEDIPDDPVPLQTTVTAGITNAIVNEDETTVTTEFIHGILAEGTTEVPTTTERLEETTEWTTTYYDPSVPVKFIDAAILRVTSDYSWLDNYESGYIYCIDATMDDVPDFVVLDTSVDYRCADIETYMAYVYDLKDMYNVGAYLENEYMSAWAEYVDPNGVHTKYATFNDYSTGITSYTRLTMNSLGLLNSEAYIERTTDYIAYNGEEITTDQFADIMSTQWEDSEYIEPRDYIKGVSIETLKSATDEMKYNYISTMFGDYAGMFSVPDLSTIWE
jgi:hypothetical protein